jgi:coenzyme PQQ precursor peptide PqqA
VITWPERQYRLPNEATLEEEVVPMSWTTPTLVEICIGLEINGYLPAEL